MNTHLCRARGFARRLELPGHRHPGQRRAIGLMIILMLVAVHGQADQQIINTTHALQARVTCGDTTALHAAGPEALNHADIDMAGNTLRIRARPADHKATSGQPHLVITTATPLATIEVGNGTALQVASCAVNQDSISILVATGAHVTMQGSTQRLDLRIGSGGEFIADHPMTINEATVNISGGGRARLCRAARILGDIKIGGSILVGNSSDTEVRRSFSGLLQRCNADDPMVSRLRHGNDLPT